MVLIGAVVLLETVSLAGTIVVRLFGSTSFPLQPGAVLESFDTFLLVLVGLELLATLKAYFEEHLVHAEIVFVAAMVAVTRKVITFDVQRASPFKLVAVAAAILALTVGYYLLKRAPFPANPKPPGGADEDSVQG